MQAGALALLAFVGKSLSGTLAERLTLPLRHRAQHIQHQPTSGRAGIDVVSHREQRNFVRRKILFHKSTKVFDRACQPVKLGNQQSIDLALTQHTESPLKAFTLEGFGTDTSVNDHLDKLKVIELGVG